MVAAILEGRSWCPSISVGIVDVGLRAIGEQWSATNDHHWLLVQLDAAVEVDTGRQLLKALLPSVWWCQSLEGVGNVSPRVGTSSNNELKKMETTGMFQRFQWPLVLVSSCKQKWLSIEIFLLLNNASISIDATDVFLSAMKLFLLGNPIFLLLFNLKPTTVQCWIHHLNTWVKQQWARIVLAWETNRELLALLAFVLISSKWKLYGVKLPPW